MIHSKIKCFITLLIYFYSLGGSIAQYNCGTATVIANFPYSASGLMTSSEASYQASAACSDDYQEQYYIFKYTPNVDESINISLSTNSFGDISGIYIFNDCNLPLTQCLVFEENTNGVVDISLIVTPGQEYYFFIGTQEVDNFDITFSRESVDGIAINKTAPTQTLDVNGAIRIGEGSTTPYKGTIRWNDAISEFEGYNGSEWVLLSFTPKKKFGTNTITELQKISTAGVAGDRFGYSVSIAGDYAIVGAPFKEINTIPDQGQAYVYRRTGSTWTQEAILVASDGATQDNFGTSVSISGDYAIVGANNHNINGKTNQGKAYVFHRSGSSWTQEAILVASDGAAEDKFGFSVSISGDYAIVGAYAHNTNMISNQGKSYVYHRTGVAWTEEAMLIASDGAAEDNFGTSVAISGNHAIVGAYTHDTNMKIDQGKAYIYTRNGSTWTQGTMLVAQDGAAEDRFGVSVSISGDYAIVGAYLHDPNGILEQGKAYIYRRSGGSWIQEAGLVSSDGAAFDRFGISVSISEEYAIVGAYNHDTNGNIDQGKAYLYRRNGSTWTQEVAMVSLDGATTDDFGSSVSVSGDKAIVGARFKNVNGNVQQGQVYFY